MTTPNIDSILSAISASPGGGPTRSPPAPELFREHLQLQPYEPAGPPVDSPENAPQGNDVSDGDGRSADEAAERTDNDTAARAEEASTTDSQCVAVGCGVHTVESPQQSGDGEAPVEGGNASAADEAAEENLRLQSGDEHDTLQIARTTIANKSSTPESAVDAEAADSNDRLNAATNPRQAASVAAVGETSATEEQDNVPVAAAASAFDVGEAEEESPTSVVPTADKRTAKRSDTAKPNIKADGESGEKLTLDKPTTSNEAKAAAGGEASPDDDGGKQRRGHERPTAAGEGPSSNTEPVGERPPSADTRHPSVRPTTPPESTPVAGEQSSPAAPPATETSPTPPSTSQPTSVPTATAASSERLSKAPGQSQSADRPSRAALTEAQQARLVQRVAKAFDVAQNRGETTIRLRLSPPQLGSLRLEVQMESGALTARLEVETHAAREALVDNLHALRQRLAEQNIRIENFDVDLTDRRQEGPAGREENSTTPQDRERQPSARRGRATDHNDQDRNRDHEGVRRSHLVEDTNIDVMI